MRDFLTACCLALVIEGVAYALFPGAMQRMIATMLALDPQTLRMLGLVTAVAGICGIWLVRAAILTP